MPNLLPDWLPWIQPAGRLIWSTLMLVVGVLFILVLMKPPLLKRPFPDRVGYALFAIVPILAYAVAVLLPDEASLWDWELDAIIVDLVLVFLVAHSLAMVASRRPRPADHVASWAACYAGAVVAFALMALAYGVVPHEWMEFANGYLQWGETSRFLFQSSQDMLIFPWAWPFNMDYPALRDIVVSGLYVVILGLNVVLFVKWQARNTVTETAAPDTAPVKRSRFGRPLRRGAATPAAGGA
ncbi:MAG: hypothetical protein ACKOA9_03995 [Actinomycetota bacterium]